MRERVGYKGISSEDASCDSRNTQQDPSVLSKADTKTHKLREALKTQTGEGGRKKSRGTNWNDSELVTKKKIKRQTERRRQRKKK